MRVTIRMYELECVVGSAFVERNRLASDAGVLRLVARGGYGFLAHDGTGEVKKLELPDDEPPDLTFSTGGVGLVRHSKLAPQLG